MLNKSYLALYKYNIGLPLLMLKKFYLTKNSIMDFRLHCWNKSYLAEKINIALQLFMLNKSYLAENSIMDFHL